MARPSAWMIVPNLLRTLMRGDVSLKSKFILLASILYLISPVDLLPDFLVGVGWIDDLLIVPFLGWLSYRSLPVAVRHDVVAEGVVDQKGGGRAALYLTILIIAVLMIVVLGSYEIAVVPERPIMSQ